MAVCTLSGSTGAALCVVQGFENMASVYGPILNDWGCPLLNLSNYIFTTSALNIRCSVSIVHECSGNCTFLEEVVAQTHEREEIQHKVLRFKHDWSSPLYCYNAFCLI